MRKTLPVNSQLMRRLNRTTILNTIRTMDSISQAEIVRNSRLGSTTVSEIINELKKDNLIKEIGPGESPLGRKPRLLRFNPKAGHVLGVDVDVDKIRVSALDLSGDIEDEIILASESEDGEEKVLATIEQGVKDILGKIRLSTSQIFGLGICFEGEIDSHGSVIFSANFGWRNIPLKTIIEERCNIPTFVEDNMRARSLGEYWFGAGQNISNLVCLYVGTGVGAGIIIDGKPYRGMHSRAGEIGHTSVASDGPKCKCGKRGCLEIFTSNPSIISRVEKAITEGRETLISNIIQRDHKGLTLDAIFDAVREGDRLAKEILEQTGYYLGLGVSNIVNSFDPEMVILSGDIIDKSRGLLLDIIRETAKVETLDGARRTMQIEEGILKENAGVVGAATLVYQDMFRLPLHV